MENVYIVFEMYNETSLEEPHPQKEIVAIFTTMESAEAYADELNEDTGSYSSVFVEEHPVNCF